MTEVSKTTINVNILGFKVPITTCDDVPDVPEWLQNNQIIKSIADLSSALVDVE